AAARDLGDPCAAGSFGSFVSPLRAGFFGFSQFLCKPARGVSAMDLSLNEHQRMLAQSVRTFMERRTPRSKIVALQRSELGYETETWKTVAELGWLGLLIPERYAGGGASLTDAAVLYQEFGRGPLPGPFFGSSILSALILLEAGNEQQRLHHLPAIAR